MTELKRCPFCGGEASIYHGDSTDGYIKGPDYVLAFCGWCGASIREKKEDEVIKKWNKRPNPWHTGIPTDEGDYLVRVRVNGNKDTDFYQIMRLSDFISYLKGQDKFYAGAFYKVLAWQKIEEGEEVNG